VRLWNQPERFDPARGSLRSFLLAQTHGRSIDRLRADTARRGREDRDSRLTATRAYDVELEAADLVVAEHVRAALGVLTDNERSVVELAYFGGHTYSEVAAMLQTPPGTVKSRMRSALTKLRHELVTAGVVEQ
jgi:RNA polymerase sigma-70 factor (ECF subfamily)